MTDALEIARVGPDQVGEVLPMLTTQLLEHGAALTADELARAARGLVEVEGRGAILVARAPGPVGVAVLAYTWTLEHGGRAAWLDELYVVPERRGAGIGQRMLAAALTVARADGCLGLDLEVDADHARAESLYLREGFVKLPRRRFARRLA